MSWIILVIAMFSHVVFLLFRSLSALSFRFGLLRKYLHMLGRAAQTQLKGFSKLIGFNYFGFSSTLPKRESERSAHAHDALLAEMICRLISTSSSTLRDFAVHCIRVNWHRPWGPSPSSWICMRKCFAIPPGSRCMDDYRILLFSSS